MKLLQMQILANLLADVLSEPKLHGNILQEHVWFQYLFFWKYSSRIYDFNSPSLLDMTVI